MQIEILALRHQLGVLQRRTTKRASLEEVKPCRKFKRSRLIVQPWPNAMPFLSSPVARDHAFFLGTA
jgi:hypothetical protein